jgi:hypothetical protein
VLRKIDWKRSQITDNTCWKNELENWQRCLNFLYFILIFFLFHLLYLLFRKSQNEVRYLAFCDLFSNYNVPVWYYCDDETVNLVRNFFHSFSHRAKNNVFVINQFEVHISFSFFHIFSQYENKLKKNYTSVNEIVEKIQWKIHFKSQNILYYNETSLCDRNYSTVFRKLNYGVLSKRNG